MPFVRISLPQEVPAGARGAIADAVHESLVGVAGIPPAERFQIVSGHPPGELIVDPHFPDAERQRPVLVQITLVRGKGEAVKKELFADIARRLAQVGVRGDDVFVTLTENDLIDWSAANGVAHLVR